MRSVPKSRRSGGKSRTTSTIIIIIARFHLLSPSTSTLPHNDWIYDGPVHLKFDHWNCNSNRDDGWLWMYGRTVNDSSCKKTKCHGRIGNSRPLNHVLDSKQRPATEATFRGTLLKPPVYRHVISYLSLKHEDTPGRVPMPLKTKLALKLRLWSQ
jgi:hypothetical protein